MLSPMRIFTVALVSGVLFLNGCVTGRGLVSLAPPTSDKVATSNGIEISIHSVAPKSPNIPSLNPAEPENDTIRLRAVARKRNTYGKAWGDILLNEGQTVESVIHDSLRQAFIENGYTVIESNPDKSSHIVDVQINKFWTWMNPGFWALTLSTEIATDITVKKANGEDKKIIYVKAADSFQTGLEDNYLSVMNSALKDYISEVKTKFK